MFIITRSINDYNQDGEYFEVAFDHIPALAELSDFFYNKKLEELEDGQLLFLAHIRNGGGRQNTENEWYCSYTLKSGQKID